MKRTAGDQPLFKLSVRINGEAEDAVEAEAVGTAVMATSFVEAAPDLGRAGNAVDYLGGHGDGSNCCYF